MGILLATLLGGFSSDVSVHKQSGSDQVLVRSKIVSFITREQHADTFVSVLSGDPLGEVLMADQTAVEFDDTGIHSGDLR